MPLGKECVFQDGTGGLRTSGLLGAGGTQANCIVNCLDFLDGVIVSTPKGKDGEG